MSSEYQDFSKVINEEVLLILNPILEATQHRLFNENIDRLSGLFIEEYEKKSSDILITDKHMIYRSLWKNILEKLYTIYLPGEKYNFNWFIELTPHSFFLWLTSSKELSFKELDKLVSHYNIDYEQLELNLNTCIEKMNLSSSKISIETLDVIPNNIKLSTNRENLSLILSLLNIPPLEEIYIFTNKFITKNIAEENKLNKVLNKNSIDLTPRIQIPNILNNAYFYVDHALISKDKWDNLIKKPFLEKHIDSIKYINEVVKSYNKEIEDNFICPCCGEKSLIHIPKDIIRVKLLIENRELYRDIGFYYFNEYLASFFSNVIKSIQNFDKNINNTPHPDCLILVEGESEEVFIPLVSLRINLDIRNKNVKVYNSKSKQKLLADFLSFKDKYPDLKMICLLDSDAIKEKNEIQRIINNNLDKYRLIYIDHGAFEDLFDKNTAIEIINKMYPNGEHILLDDIDNDQEFAKSISNILFEKKKEKFDKVKFAKKMAQSININAIPKEIHALFEYVTLLTEKSKFITR